MTAMGSSRFWYMMSSHPSSFPPPPIPHTDSKLLQWMTTFSLAASLTRRKHDFKCSQNFLLGRTSAGGGTLCDSLNASLPMNSFSWEVSPSPRPHSHLSTIVSEQTNYSELCKEKLIKCRLITGNLIWIRAIKYHDYTTRWDDQLDKKGLDHR